MKKEVGLWIDHRKAVLVFLLEDSEEIKEITSHMDKHVRYSGASESNGSHNDAAEDTRDRRFDDHLNTYYDEVIVPLHDADSILILGPGEAKIELHKRLVSHDHDHAHSERTIVTQPADKMTDNQIVAEVRQHFRGSQHR